MSYITYTQVPGGENTSGMVLYVPDRTQPSPFQSSGYRQTQPFHFQNSGYGYGSLTELTEVPGTGKDIPHNSQKGRNTNVAPVPVPGTSVSSVRLPHPYPDLLYVKWLCSVGYVQNHTRTKVILDGLKRNLSRGNSLSDELELRSVFGDTRAYLYSPAWG